MMTFLLGMWVGGLIGVLIMGIMCAAQSRE